MTKYGDYRPAFVTQRDGSSLANSNCRMASISMGLAYDASPQGSKTSTGKEMRTYTDDQSGGTDSGDAKQAWDRGYDEGLRVMDGNTFDSALADLRAGRLVHLDVWHAKAYACRSGDGTYGHTMAIAPDLNADGWVVGDPWCTDGWHRISESKLRSAAEYWGGQVYGKAAQEPDYPTGGPDPRDPRVLLIVARIVKRLMAQYHPGNPAGDALDDPGDTGGGAILYTTTRAVPATGGSDMGIYWDPTQWNDPGLTLYLDWPVRSRSGRRRRAGSCTAWVRSPATTGTGLTAISIRSSRRRNCRPTRPRTSAASSGRNDRNCPSRRTRPPRSGTIRYGRSPMTSPGATPARPMAAARPRPMTWRPARPSTTRTHRRSWDRVRPEGPKGASVGTC